MIQNIFNSINDLHTKQQELAAIWLENRIQTATENTRRICAGQLVAIKDGKLVDCTDDATHKIILCLGTMNSQFEITVINLITNEPLQIPL